MKKILVSQLGARMHYAVPRALDRLGCLSEFHTDLYIRNPVILTFLKKVALLLRIGLIRRLSGRFDSINSDLVTSDTWFGLKYNWKLKYAKNTADLAQVFWHAGIEFNQRFINRLLDKRLGTFQCIYSYCRESLELFKYGKANGVQCVLEQYILPRELMDEILIEECKMWPDLQSIYGSGYIEQSKMLYDVEIAEWKLADVIICPSQFVIDGIVKLLPESFSKIHYLPYSYTKRDVGKLCYDATGKKKILFVGDVGLRKGAHYLIHAAKKFDENVEFIFAGSISLPLDFIKQNAGSNCSFLGVVPRGEMAELYKQATVFVLPSLCEGSATVIYEAMNYGVPVICTYNSGAPFSNGIEGYIIKIRDIEELVYSISMLLENNELREMMSNSCLKKIEEFSFEIYSRRLNEILQE